ncbi:MAG TPA: hypothetical protein VJ831_09240 [Jatrophihabitantaceae bacterium]|nr:hypothetical protein [Jatrophihabitantaceae bacterium]
MTPTPTLTPPPASPTAPATQTSSLDLSDAPAATPIVPPVQRRAELPAPPRLGATGRLVLGERNPTVTLTRLQSGIGTVTIEAAASPDAGDLRLGAAYDLASGITSTVQLAGGRRTAPPESRRPVLVASHDRYEQIGIDLRQVRELRRLVVYAFSENGMQLTWAGTLIVSTSAGARIEIPLDGTESGQAAVLVSMYQVSGEFVVRSEKQGSFGSVRDACRAFGFDDISWVDDRTPVD